jgi:putative phosphoribosyl transferase
MSRFDDRHHAGSLLASALLQYDRLPGVIVLGLPRGGIPVAYEVAFAVGTAPVDQLPG